MLIVSTLVILAMVCCLGLSALEVIGFRWSFGSHVVSFVWKNRTGQEIVVGIPIQELEQKRTGFGVTKSVGYWGDDYGDDYGDDSMS